MRKFLLLVLLVALVVAPTLAQETDLEANKALVMRFVDELWGGNLDVADEILADDFFVRFPSGIVVDRETYLAESVAPSLAAFPDWSTEIDAILAEGDMVALVYNWGGTFENEFMGIPPTGQPLRLNGIDFLRIEDGKIVEFVLTWSTLSWMQQAGVVPAEGEVLPEEPWGVTLGESSSTPAENKMMTYNGIAALNEGCIACMDDIFTDDVTIHWESMGVSITGLDVLRETWRNMKAETPDHRVVPGYMVAEGDLVAGHTWFYSPWPGVRMACLDRYEDGKTAEQWCVWDNMPPAEVVEE
jgi:hypothetical protein